jgi:hypothetical protein
VGLATSLRLVPRLGGGVRGAVPPLPQGQGQTYLYIVWLLCGGQDVWHEWGRRGVYRVLVGRPESKRPLEDLGVGGRITLSWTLGRYGWMGELDSDDSG